MPQSLILYSLRLNFNIKLKARSTCVLRFR